MTNQPASLGARLLSRYLDDHRITFEAARLAIGAAHRSSVYQWATGSRVPRTIHAVAIDRWTGGAVPVASWGVADIATPPEAA